MSNPKEDQYAKDLLIPGLPRLKDYSNPIAFRQRGDVSAISEPGVSTIPDEGLRDHMQQFESFVAPRNHWRMTALADGVHADKFRVNRSELAWLVKHVKASEMITPVRFPDRPTLGMIGQDDMRVLATFSHELRVLKAQGRSTRNDISLEEIVVGAQNRLGEHPLAEKITGLLNLVQLEESSSVVAQQSVAVEESPRETDASDQPEAASEEQVVFSGQEQVSVDELIGTVADEKLRGFLAQIQADVINKVKFPVRTTEVSKRAIAGPLGLDQGRAIHLEYLLNRYRVLIPSSGEPINNGQAWLPCYDQQTLLAFATLAYELNSLDVGFDLVQLVSAAREASGESLIAENIHDPLPQYGRKRKKENVSARTIFAPGKGGQGIPLAAGIEVTVQEASVDDKQTEAAHEELSEESTEEASETSAPDVAAGEHNFPKPTPEQRVELRGWDAKKIEKTRVLLAQNRPEIISYQHVPYFVALTIVCLDAYWDSKKDLQKVDFRRDTFSASEIIAGLIRVEDVFEAIRQKRRKENPEISREEMNEGLNLDRIVLMVQRQLKNKVE